MSTILTHIQGTPIDVFARYKYTSVGGFCSTAYVTMTGLSAGYIIPKIVGRSPGDRGFWLGLVADMKLYSIHEQDADIVNLSINLQVTVSDWPEISGSYG